MPLKEVANCKALRLRDEQCFSSDELPSPHIRKADLSRASLWFVFAGFYFFRPLPMR